MMMVKGMRVWEWLMGICVTEGALGQRKQARLRKHLDIGIARKKSLEKKKKPQHLPARKPSSVSREPIGMRETTGEFFYR